jgi:hypothetical protein
MPGSVGGARKPTGESRQGAGRPPYATNNNESGGAARIEGYKEFVRVRLTKETLTAYVIAIDEPATDGEKLAPRIVDTFTLTVRSEKTG